MAEKEKKDAQAAKTASETVEDDTQKQAEAVKAAPAREDVYIPKGYANDEANLFVSVNGVNYLLPKGKTSNVPAHVAAEIRRSLKAQEAYDQRKDDLLEASK